MREWMNVALGHLYAAGADPEGAHAHPFLSQIL